MSHTFVCEICGTPCIATNSEADANKEYMESGQGDLKSGGRLLSVCDDCYIVAMNRARELGLLNQPDT